MKIDSSMVYFSGHNTINPSLPNTFSEIGGFEFGDTWCEDEEESEYDYRLTRAGVRKFLNHHLLIQTLITTTALDDDNDGNQEFAEQQLPKIGFRLVATGVNQNCGDHIVKLWVYRRPKPRSPRKELK